MILDGIKGSPVAGGGLGQVGTFALIILGKFIIEDFITDGDDDLFPPA